MRSILSILRGRFRMDFQRFDIIHEIARIVPYPGRSSTCPNGNCCSRYYTQIASKINHPSGPSRSALALVHCGDIPQLCPKFFWSASAGYAAPPDTCDTRCWRVSPCPFPCASFLHPSVSLNLFPALSLPGLSLSFAGANYC